MLTAKVNTTQEVVFAKDGIRNVDYVCRDCLGKVVLKKGDIYTHHFAHKSTGECSQSFETEVHRGYKLAIYEALKRKGVEDLQLETKRGEIRPDVSFIVNGRIKGIEVQCSNLPLDIIRSRHHIYENQDMDDLWIITKGLPSPIQYAPKQFERYLHNVYGIGAFYHSTNNKNPLTLQCVTFHEHLLYQRTFEGPNGEIYGGYHYPAKRWVNTSAVPIKLLDLCRVDGKFATKYVPLISSVQKS